MKKDESGNLMSNTEYVNMLLSYDSIVDYMVQHLIIDEDTQLFRHTIFLDLKEAYIKYRLHNSLNSYHEMRQILKGLLTRTKMSNVFTEDQCDDISMKLKFEII